MLLLLIIKTITMIRQVRITVINSLCPPMTTNPETLNPESRSFPHTRDTTPQEIPLLRPNTLTPDYPCHASHKNQSGCKLLYLAPRGQLASQVQHKAGPYLEKLLLAQRHSGFSCLWFRGILTSFSQLNSFACPLTGLHERVRLQPLRPLLACLQSPHHKWRLPGLSVATLSVHATS